MVVPLGLLVGSLPSVRLKFVTRVPAERRATEWFFLFMPYIYAFGTANIYWVPIASAGIFVIFWGLISISASSTPKKNEQILAFSMLVQIFVFFLFLGALQNPYRQPHSLLLNDTIGLIGKQKSILILSNSSAQYLDAARTITSQGNFVAGTPMLDLTGKSPGLVFALGGNSIGLPWILGGYSGSFNYALAGLRDVPCRTLLSAWLIIEPNDDTSIHSKILDSFGTNLEQDYELVGSLQTMIKTTQRIYKPSRTLQERLCI